MIDSGTEYINRLPGKLLNLESKRAELDPGIFPILQRFNGLPFRSRQSCTGHTDTNGNLTEDAHIQFDMDPTLDENEIRIQNDFINHLPNLNIVLSKRLGLRSTVPIFRLEDDPVETLDGHDAVITVKEALDNDLPVTMFVRVKDLPIKENDGNKTLTIVWEEFWKYMNDFDGAEKPVPDFEGGKVFVKKTP